MMSVEKVKGAGLLEALSALSQGQGQGQVAAAVKLVPLAIRAHQSQGQGQDSSYVLGRLVRGTAAAKMTTREMFFAALVALLDQDQDHITIGLLLDILDKQLHLGGQSKSETGETCTGRVLTCGAIVRSKLFRKSSAEGCELVLKCMYASAAKRSYLGLAAHMFVADYLSKCDEDHFRESVWPHLQSELVKPPNDQNLDSLYCLSVALARFPNVCKKSVKKLTGQSTLFSEEAAPAICEKLMNIPDFAFINHPVYSVFGKQIASSRHLLKYWHSIEAKLSLRNPNRILVTLTVLGEILGDIGENAKSIPNLLDSKFLSCILEWFKGFKSANNFKKYKRKHGKDAEGQLDRQIVTKAKMVFDLLANSVRGTNVDGQTKVTILEKLLVSPGDIMFSDITNTRCVKTIIDSLSAEGVKDFAALLRKIMCNDLKKVLDNGGERPWTNNERVKAAEIYGQMISHKAVSDDLKWRIDGMKFLLQVGVFRTSGENNEMHFGTDFSVAVKKCFFRSLDMKFSKLETLLNVLTSLIEFVDDEMNTAKKREGFSRLLSANLVETWESLKSFRAKIMDSKKSGSKEVAVFQVLALQCGLFLFSDTFTVEMTKSTLEEIKSCYEHFETQNNSKTTRKTITEGEIIDDEPEWVEVLIDMFLNFLSRDSHLLRIIVQCVFKLLCENLTPSAIGQLLAVLDPTSEVNPLSIHGEESDDEVDDDIDEEDHDDDAKDEESESSGSEKEDDDENITVNDQFRIAVQQALGNSAPETDTESIDLDDIDEEEGKKLDTALSNAFKMLKETKKKTLSKKEKKDKKLLTDFRIRVLDLIDIYLEKEPSMELALGMLTPLFSCLEFCVKDNDQSQLEARLRKTLKHLTTIKSFSSLEGVTSDILLHHLNGILEKGERTQFVFKVLGDVISKCSCFIVRCLIRIENTLNVKKRKKLRTPIVELLKESLNNFFSKRDCLLPVILFYNLLQLSWEGNWDLLFLITKRTFEDNLRPFRRNEGFEMLNIFYRNLKRQHNQDQIEQSVDDLNKLENMIAEYTVKTLEECDQAKSFNVKSFPNLLNLLLNIKNHNSSCKLDWEQIKSAVQTYRSRSVLKNCQEYVKFCKKFEIQKRPNPIIQKNENEDSGHDSNMHSDSDPETSENKKKKKKGIKQRNKANQEISKKEAKRLRAQASAEGLENVSFSGFLNMDVNMDDVEELTETKENGKKRKSSTIEGKKKKKLKMS